MALSQTLVPHMHKAIEALFGVTVESVEMQATRRDFEGDITMVIFPLLKVVKSNPAELGNKIGQYLVDNTDVVERFNVVSGFLNIVISDAYYINFFNNIKGLEQFGHKAPDADGKAVMVEYASPNTNKPLHLGHVRNVLLGYSVAQILQAAGNKVYKTQVINDRGIHICKSMLAYEKFGHGETPQSESVKGDKLVGNYYVEFENRLRLEAQIKFDTYKSGDFTGLSKEDVIKVRAIIEKLHELIRERQELVLSKYDNLLGDVIPKQIYSEDYQNQEEETKEQKNHVLYNNKYFVIRVADLKRNQEAGYDTDINIKTFEQKIKSLLDLEERISEKYAELMDISRKETSIMKEAQEMLRKWEAGDKDVVALWEKMNGWVYKGFKESFKAIGVNFDKDYYESDTYLLGKDVVADGLAKGVFYKKEDGSVWIDLTGEGLDEKLVLRRDGTSVYMTQDIGTAIQRVKDFPDVGGMVYTVGNEQDYHFKVLFLILKKLGFDWAANLYHLSYGMVDLPSGKMKSREGTVVDADDLMAEMTTTAKEISEELGKLEGYSDEDKERLYNIIGLGALKYYILKVDPKKRILFNPKESVDFAGNTGPFIQYTYARIQSLLRKAGFDYERTLSVADVTLHEKEKELIKMLEQYPAVIQAAAEGHSPALVANYTYDLVKEYNSFYQSVPVLGSEVENEKIFRVQLSKKVGETIKLAFGLLGIGVPERM